MGLLTNQYVSESYQGLLNLNNPNTGLTSTLQTVTDGLGGTSPLQISKTQVNISGSLTINGSPVAATDTGSLMKTGSVAGNTLTFTKGDGSQFSLAVTSSLPSGTISGSQQIIDLGFLQTGSFNSYTSSNDSKVNSLIASTGSYATTSSITSLSQSIATTDLGQNNRLGSLEGKTGSYATTGSNNFVGQQNINGSVNVTGSLNITGTVTATSASFTYVNTVYETASVIYSSGSNQFGDASNDTQTLWGTVNLPSGPLVITGSITATGGFTGSLQGSASYALNSLSSSYSNFALSASQAQNAVTASFLLGTVASASYAVNADTASIANDLIVRGKCNNTGGLTRGTIVRITGADGDNPLFDSASWLNDANSANTLGMLSEDVVHNGFANVVVQGKVIGINTQGMNAGDLLFLSSSGQYTTSSVPAPYHEVRLGQVLRANLNNGSAYITIDNGYELTELHDVDITSVAVGDVLTYVSGAYGQWVNKTVDELGYLQTSSFNTYTASMDARTGSYATTGSNRFNGNQTITGSVTISGSAQVELDVKGDLTNTGSLSVRSGSIFSLANSTTLDVNNFLSSSEVGQANFIKGWYDNPASGGPLATQANYTGSLRVTGSNNIFSLPQARATGFGLGSDLQGYISGSDNVIAANNAGIYLNTGSLLFPKLSNNYVGQSSFIGMNFTTSSIAGGHPNISSNTIYGGQITVNHNSGSIGMSTNLINAGSITSTQNFVTNTRPQNSGNIVGNGVTLNHISSSINFSQNLLNSPITINNHLSSSIANNSLTFTNNAVFGGSSATGLGVWVSGSQATNVTRTISDNLIGGRNIIVSSSFVGSSNSNLQASLIYGLGLTVSGSQLAAGGGSSFLGRFNDTGSLALAQDIVFAVGTGVSTAARRTGLYIDSGSNVVTSGSFRSIGNATVTGSLGVTGSVFVTGSVQGNVNNLTVAANTASLNLNDGNFFVLQLTGSIDTHINPSNIKPGQTVNIRLNTTGSGTVSFPTGIVKQASGSAYVPTTGTSTDIITLVSFDNTTLFLANVKNLI